MTRVLSHVVGFDDAPFERSHRGDVPLFGAIFSGQRFEGLIRRAIRRDGRNSTDVVARSVNQSRYGGHLQAILLQGIAFGGFNVVDIHRLHELTGRPVLVVMRRAPDLPAIRAALLERVPGGRAKWRLIEWAGPPESSQGLFIQRAGLDTHEASALLARLAISGKLPEPLRYAHIIAGGVTHGESRGRP